MSLQLNENNIEDFLSQKCALKAILFTKKVETPTLWLKLMEVFSGRFVFGEIRQTEESLLTRFCVTQDSLPKIIGIRENFERKSEIARYEGPIDFERIKEFFAAFFNGGVVAVELMRQLSEVQRQNRCLEADLFKEKEATQLALAEVARAKLVQVGQVEAVRKNLELEVQEMKQHDVELMATITAEIEELKSVNHCLAAENAEFQEKLRALEAANARAVVVLKPNNFEPFLNSACRPLKAVLFSTKAETPVLWQQLAQSHSLTTSFGLVRHTEHDLLLRFKLRPDALPRIYLFGNARDTPMPYDGPVNIESIAAFLRDAVEGGPACIEMRRLLQVGLRLQVFSP
jgi:hypothetical protein